MLTLYYAPGACSLAPHIVLRELGLAFDLVRVDLKAKTYAGGDYRAINPKGGVPALALDNGEVLTEVAVVLRYLADRKPDVGLVPSGPGLERYRCEEWLNFIATELHKGFAPLWKPDTPADYKPIAEKNLGRPLGYVNAHLGRHDYLMGTTYTVADAYLFTVANWARVLKMDLGQWPALERFMERIKKRPATLAALQAEGLT